MAKTTLITFVVLLYCNLFHCIVMHFIVFLLYFIQFFVLFCIVMYIRFYIVSPFGGTMESSEGGVRSLSVVGQYLCGGNLP